VALGYEFKIEIEWFCSTAVFCGGFFNLYNLFLI
jgi:hypothetical protein